nr:UDP-glucuronosyltransferase UGT45E1 [Tuta absoluta]
MKILLCLLFCAHHALALNILAIASLPLRSHYMAFHPFFRELATRGHHVTVMNNYPDDNAPPLMRFVNMNADNNGMIYITPLNVYEKFNSDYLHLYNFYRHLVLSTPSAKTDCENFFTNENVKAQLAKGIKYDVIFVEMFGVDCGLAFAGAMFDAPIIGIASHVMQPLAYPRLGLPFDFGSDAFYYSNAGFNPSLYQKVEAFIINIIDHIYVWYTHNFIVYEVFNRYLPNNSLDIEWVARERVKMYFSYQHFSLTGARVSSPQVLEIGGIHIGKAKPLDQKLEKFLSNADQGAIFVSFGSNLKANGMSPEKRQEFLNAFMKIPQKVIWKYENETLAEEYHDKVYFGNWLPQLDILCHPKVVGFVSHGGMLSLSESTHCGKPLVVTPFFGDQFSNAAAAEQAGIGILLHFDQLDGDSLADAIQYITSSTMQQNAKTISKLWHDRPMPVMESAIYWTEYVARNHDADAPPSLPSKRSTWFEKSLIDVALILLAIFLAPILFLAAVVKLMKSLFFKSEETAETKKANKKKPKKS